MSVAASPGELIRPQEGAPARLRGVGRSRRATGALVPRQPRQSAVGVGRGRRDAGHRRSVDHRRSSRDRPLRPQARADRRRLASDADELADHLDLERFAVLGEMFTEGLKGVPIGIRDLRKIRDYDAGWHDHLPFLYSFLAYAHRAKLNLRDREPLHRGDGRRHHLGGEPIAGLNPEDSKFLDQLEAEGLDPR